MKRDLRDVVRVGGVGKGEGGDRDNSALKLLRLAALRRRRRLLRFFSRERNATKENLVVDLPALDFALSTARDEDVAVAVVGEAPRLAAVTDDRLDAVLRREVEELEEGVFRGGDEVRRGLGGGGGGRGGRVV